MTSGQNRVEALLPVELGRARVRYAPGMRAGNWVFATGHLAQDFATGIDPAVSDPRAPHYDRPRHEREAERIYRNIEAVLGAAGAGFANVARLDQYFLDQRAVDPYHTVRRTRLGAVVPPSTSVLVRKLLLPGADMEVQVIAALPGAGVPQKLRQPDLDGPPTSGYSAALRAGDFVFCAGAFAGAGAGQPARHGLALSASMPDGALWRGQPIKLEAEYILHEKLEPALALAGCTLADVVKAQIYLTRVEDAAAFNQVWNRTFADAPAAATIVICENPGLGLAAARVEINALALAPGGGAGKRAIACDVAPPYRGHVVAVRAGDFLFLSGLMASDADGLLPEVAVDPRQPYFHCTAAAQARAILRNADAICRAAGARLSDVVRIQQFHTDLGEFYPVYQVWQEVLPGRALPISALEVPAMTVPGCTLLIDLWVYAPAT
jgi:enamine deaminase RidA (YjgF/YER057c/UK114 family)